MSHYARRKDANQPTIERALRAAGCYVHDTHNLGGGFADLVVVRHGCVYLAEVKDGSLAPSARRLTKPEQDFAVNVGLAGGKVHLFESIVDALSAVGIVGLP